MLLNLPRRAVVQPNPEKVNSLKQYNALKNKQNNNKQTQKKGSLDNLMKKMSWDAPPANLVQLMGEHRVTASLVVIYLWLPKPLK